MVEKGAEWFTVSRFFCVVAMQKSAIADYKE
jgi:hypothetical protein